MQTASHVSLHITWGNTINGYIRLPTSRAKEWLNPSRAALLATNSVETCFGNSGRYIDDPPFTIQQHRTHQILTQ